MIPAKNTVILKDMGKQETKSGIVIPSSGKQIPEIGIVHKVGKEKEKGDLSFPLKPGDKIVYRKYSDNKVYIENQYYNFIDFKDIVAKL